MIMTPDCIAATEARLATDLDWWIENVDGAAVNVVQSKSFDLPGRGRSWNEATRNFLINNRIDSE
jgi:hypothetical protein